MALSKFILLKPGYTKLDSLRIPSIAISHFIRNVGLSQEAIGNSARYNKYIEHGKVSLIFHWL